MVQHRARSVTPPALIEVHVEQIEQLFYSIDPSPFHARDLDPQADEYIVACARELPHELPLALVVHLDCPPEQEIRLAQVEGAIRSHFAASARVTLTQLRDLFHRGRISLLIGMAFLSVSIALGELSQNWLPRGSPGNIVRESLLIGGWVAMWRPMEIFLYDWWPVAARIRLLDRLAVMPTRIIQRRHRVPESSRPSEPGQGFSAPVS
ncbi:hypothetical protein [Malikia sp.]|uniref:hypothetical protein n=1 Tax=Malikia sp. TaxID=2070706 RepID=UPI00261B1A83|nr:hypothetical protein [Malikia sp.]MDD2730021.1 hypothetical protein [Malikia sp.]